MIYKRLGRTNLAVSAIGIGTGDNAGLFVSADDRTLRGAVERATELGINYYDTSPDYGRGIAEFRLGRLIKDLNIDPIIASKVEFYAPSLKNLEVATLAGIEASLARLQRDYIDVVLVHNPVRKDRRQEDFSRYWIPLLPAEVSGPIRSALEKAKSQGKIRYTGLATEDATPDAVAEVLATKLFDVANVWINAVNPSALVGVNFNSDMGADYHGIAEKLVEFDAGCVAIRPLAGGALTEDALKSGGERRHPYAGGGYSRNLDGFRQEVQRGQVIQQVAQKAGISAMEASYRFLFGRSEIAVVLGGFSETSHIEYAADMLGKGPLDPEVATLLLTKGNGDDHGHGL